MSAADRPNQSFTEHYITTSSVGKLGVDFQFVANRVRIINDSALSVYLSFQSSAGDTGGFPIKTTCEQTFEVVTGGLSIAATASSTSNAVRIMAWR